MSTSLEVQTPLPGMRAFERPDTMDSLLKLAIQEKSAIDVIERLTALKQQERDYQARSAYFTAFTDFKKQLPRIEKTRAIKTGEGPNTKVRSMYAALEDICKVVVPLLYDLGITHRYKIRTEADGRTTVTCFLRHIDGYEEEGAQMSGLPDTSGAKSAIQADGSTTSYLERYTLVASLGLPIYGQDSDGNKQPTGEGMTEKEFAEWMSKIEGARNLKELEDVYFGAAAVATKAGDQGALKSFGKAKNDTYKQNGGWR